MIFLHFVESISLKSLSWKSIVVETHFVKSRRNNYYTQFFSGVLLLIPRLPLWLVGRPWYVHAPQQQASATEATNKPILQLLEYVSTYPNDGTTFRSSDMVHAGHPDAAYLSVNKAHSQAGAHIMLYESIPVPNINGQFLTISQIIKFSISSAAKAELTGLFISLLTCPTCTLACSILGGGIP